MDKVQENLSNIFVLSDGREVELRAVSDLWIAQAQRAVRKEFEEAGRRIDVPTISIMNIAGEVEEIKINEDLLEGLEEDKTLPNGEAFTPEEMGKWRGEWAEYVDVQAAMSVELNERNTSIWLTRGVLGCEPTEEWEQACAHYGIEVPSDPIDKRYFYLTMEVFSSRSDLLRAINRIQFLSMGDLVVDEEMIDAVEDSFRRSIQAKGREALRGVKDAIRGLVAQSETPSGEGDVGVELQTLGVEEREPGGQGVDDGNDPNSGQDAVL